MENTENLLPMSIKFFPFFQSSDIHELNLLNARWIFIFRRFAFVFNLSDDLTWLKFCAMRERWGSCPVVLPATTLCGAEGYVTRKYFAVSGTMRSENGVLTLAFTVFDLGKFRMLAEEVENITPSISVSRENALCFLGSVIRLSDDKTRFIC